MFIQLSDKGRSDSPRARGTEREAGQAEKLRCYHPGQGALPSPSLRGVPRRCRASYRRGSVPCGEESDRPGCRTQVLLHARARRHSKPYIGDRLSRAPFPLPRTRESSAHPRSVAPPRTGGRNRVVFAISAHESGETGRMRNRLCLRSSYSCARLRYNAGETHHAFRRLLQSIRRQEEWRSSIVGERARSTSQARATRRPARVRVLQRLSAQRLRPRQALRTAVIPPSREHPEPSAHQAAAASRKSPRHRSATRVAQNATASREISPRRLAVKERNPLKMIDFRASAGQCGTTPRRVALSF